jgi:hypothetical protein
MDHYVIRVDATLPDDALEGFEGLAVTYQTVQTVLHGDLPDQSALAGVLDHLDQLGVVILEVLKVPELADSALTVPGPTNGEASASEPPQQADDIGERP